ncbi:aldehyde dehydrogenase family protein [Acidiphilium sp. AL]|uniref:Aldehyde dehydrogenase family protein n=1 Tax=Acidiphilium iwatense TaxID=768198 RepID=A0ABS9E084_9PROT|nr:MULTISPECIES: aldehyde dehydrogenase family protein [Acidiphilium]MCF3948406.1 aldehyde dehydrogenase family protein [Acidiphilium iwatense]MCU4161155.1 aldehyde dehydrogenase family protein [Acidiphilium sp. AL]
MTHYNFGNLIGEGWVIGDGKVFDTLNPARPHDVIGHYSCANEADIERAMIAAGAAQTRWRRVPSVERGAVVAQFLDALTTHADELARSITLEQGKPLTEARAEVGKSIAEARFMVGEAARSHSAVFPSARPGIHNMVTRRPRGIIAAITPWNFPILTPMRKIVPALVFGNSIILKPSEFTPATSCLIGEIARKTLPSGLLQIVNGGAAVGAALISHPGVAGVTFTGSIATGKRVFTAAAENLTDVSLELGGKNAAVVHDAANLSSCLDQIVGAAFMCAGQRCTAISRVLAQTRVVRDVIDGLVERAEAVVLGDGLRQGVTMGPLTTRGQLDRVTTMVAAGVMEGAHVATGGKASTDADPEGGYFYEPTILTGVGSTMSVAREEIFGPVLSVLSYDSLDEAMVILNDVKYGLTSCLFSDTNSVIQRFIDESETGMIHINHGTIPDNHMPFGGIKASGVGAYSVGSSAANFYTTEHSIYIKATV